MSVIIHFELVTSCECIPYLQKLLLQADSLGLSSAYRQKLRDTLVALMAHLDDETAREDLYTANIEEIHTLRDSAFTSWMNSLKDSISEPQALIDLRTPPGP